MAKFVKKVLAVFDALWGSTEGVIDGQVGEKGDDSKRVIQVTHGVVESEMLSSCIEHNENTFPFATTSRSAATTCDTSPEIRHIVERCDDGKWRTTQAACGRPTRHTAARAVCQQCDKKNNVLRLCRWT